MDHYRTSQEGLSPRVRGNQDHCRHQPLWRGSIPARAGKPMNRLGICAVPWVYPRACGETIAGLPNQSCSFRGLSPRVRGNPITPIQRRNRIRSIPARAGKPWGPSPLRGPAWVYPRACGETLSDVAGTESGQGLSPRVRGNRFFRNFARNSLGSIPARAGKPSHRQRRCACGRVYPRACGETRKMLMQVP